MDILQPQSWLRASMTEGRLTLAESRDPVGERHATPIAFATREDGCVVVGCEAQDESWLRRRVSHGACTCTASGTTREYQARELTGQDADAARALLRRRYEAEAPREGRYFELRPIP